MANKHSTSSTSLESTTTVLVHGSDTATDWWRHAVIYQIYPRSFADSDGDGVGDLPGIISRLSHVARLGADAVWLSPFYTSPQHDAGYDVANYRDVDPLFGSLADAELLILRAHQLGLKVIIDLVPNHTSDEHPWFVEALAAEPGSPARDRYIFREGKGPDGSQPPTNWRSVFGGPAWTQVADGQWYLHLYDTHQPDLNWDNPEVVAEFDSVLQFWLDRGVDGFRVDVAHGLVKDPTYPDWDGVSHPPYIDQPGVHEIYRHWHEVLRSYGEDRILVAEAWAHTPEAIARYVREDEMQQAFNFLFLDTPWQAEPMRQVITESLTSNDSVGATSTWVLNNHDVLRTTARLGLPQGGVRPMGIGAQDPQPDPVLGLRNARAAAMMMLALPGSAYLYQGEELGLPEHTTMDDAVRQDPWFFHSDTGEKGRDGCRVPIPWEKDAPAFGFNTTGETWLPQPAEFGDCALDQQRGVENSTYELYRTALRLRKSLRLGSGSLAWVEGLADSEQALVFVNRNVWVISNFDSHPIPLPQDTEILLSSEELVTTDQGQAIPAGVTVWLRVENGE